MVINGSSLLQAAPFDLMLDHKAREHGVSHGLGEAGYDIRIKQEIRFERLPEAKYAMSAYDGTHWHHDCRFTLASAVERFSMPNNLVGVVHDKSTWARQGLSVFNTVVEPGWEGYLTLELVYHGTYPLRIPAGAGIAQVLFHQTKELSCYSGKYENQEDRPVPSLWEIDA